MSSPKFDWYASDHHFNHIKIITPEFEHKYRPFATLEEHNEHLVKVHNERVGPNDNVLFLGDLAFNTGLPYIGRLNGKKWLAIGNHEHKNVREYLPYFEDAKSTYEDKGEGIVFTHIPVHPSQLEKRWKVNVHGHVHSKSLPDPRYVNMSMEAIGLVPVSRTELVTIVRGRLHDQEIRGEG